MSWHPIRVAAVGTVCAVLLATTCLDGHAQGELELVAGGKSAYALYRDPGAPPSVHQAAAEIQRIVRIATGAELPITDEPASPMICLGDNAAAREAGLSVEGLPDDGFLIATKQGSLYILGKDYPGDRPPWSGWSSRGTLFGSYDFLERVVGVRWLMPGEWGEDAPRQETLTVPEMAVQEAPDFQIRALVDIQEDPVPGVEGMPAGWQWQLRQKIPSTREGRKIGHGHSWDDYLEPEAWAEHPEYLALADGAKRYVPARPAHVKYCTSNPELVRAFAQGVIARLAARPELRAASISPSDGGAFCRCPDCRPFITQDPHGRDSFTPVILRFYNEVAKLVARKHPDRILAGYVYYNYMYPPPEPVPMAPNVTLVWAPLNYYGRGLQKPVYRAEFRDVLAGWLRVTDNFIYHNYSTWMRSFNGAPLPPGLDILKLELPTLHELGVRGAEMVGTGAWGYGGPGNYILAKQLWDAEVNVDDLFTEWLQRAYGPGWEAMHQLYTLLEDRMRAWKEKESPVYRGEMYEVNYAVIEGVHRPIFPEMERLYLEALSKADTEPQRHRLEMFGDNLIALHYNMRKADMLAEPERSTCYRTDEQYQKFLADTEFSLSLYRRGADRYLYPIWKGEWSAD